MEPADSPEIAEQLPLPGREPLQAFLRRQEHHRVSAPPSADAARGRTPSGTVHLVNDAWLPVCGAGLNTWDPLRGLSPTEEPVTCRRCADVHLKSLRDDQLRLF
ncbi:hypothetical protein [Amycolatopsis magusensis]|uniref:Zinc-finger n=1 Tax=Amycolatopsis magusensis TaxID=882444 RepID=A0ABS4PI60_9PSEU|nr:hypothetical protein [Amycolatopsis magusensis]MBP2178568.1 hypothetical protein [Amycolatopsis magusensis]MDI5979364.1 hypothetical protein [Amycolatopsis magusensis]